MIRVLPDAGHLALLERIWDALPEARLVGGVVRDLLAGQAVADLDLAVPQPPEVAMARLRAHGIKVVPTGLAHGTVTAVLDGRPIEITTLRRDVETDGRHAVVAWTDDWCEDAARRDFTINAMSVDRAGLLHDYFGGGTDLAAGRVRFVGRAAERIVEDGLRMLRFFRFQARFGRGLPDADALSAIEAAAPALRLLSAERVWSELRRLLAGWAPADTLALMHRLGVLAVVLPAGLHPGRVAWLERSGAPAEPLLRLAALSDASADELGTRLRLSGAEVRRLRALRGPVPDPDAAGDGLRRLLAETDPALLVDRGWLAASASGGGADRWAGLRGRLQDVERPVFPLSGRDAVAAGVAAGPAVGEALRAVSAWWRDGGCHADRAACLARLQRLARDGA